jgi:cytochrome c biogenesis protein CcmG, thiol:disulfide interchange protein DsbE
MDKKLKLVIIIVLVVLLFGLAYFAYGQLKPQVNNEGIVDQNTSQLAPDFTLKNMAGEDVSLSDYAGKPVVLNFWASWCPPCKEEMPNFNELSNQYGTSGDVMFLMVNVTDGGRETIETATAYLSDNQYNMNVVFDTEGVASTLYNVSSIPSTFFIDSQGYINNSSVGSLTKNQLEMEITKLTTLN